MALAPILLHACRSPRAEPDPRDGATAARPNLVLVYVDDLGWGELGSYGQQRIRTPHLDQLAREGLRFTQAYAGAPVCAPARCALLTGRDPEHMAIRDNHEMRGPDGKLVEGQMPLPRGTPTLARSLAEGGYDTAAIGKWGLGGPGSGSEPRDHGFRSFYGYLCQRAAHDHYPAHLWEDDRRVELPQNLPDTLLGGAYTDDLFLERALAFVAAPRERPFFLYYALALPHLALQVPEDEVDAYRGAFDDPPYDGRRGYRAHPSPRAAYAAMITRIDRDVGLLVARLRELGLDRDTLVLFTSDNGPTHDVGGVDTGFFDSAGGLRGRKGSVWEGGLRVPLIAWWPGRIEPGGTSALPTAVWDLFPTLAEAARLAAPAGEGRSILPEMLAPGSMPAPERLAWAFPGYGGQVALRYGRWKVVQRDLARGGSAPQAFDLEADPAESRPRALADLPHRLRERSRADLERLVPLAGGAARGR